MHVTVSYHDIIIILSLKVKAPIIADILTFVLTASGLSDIHVIRNLTKISKQISKRTHGEVLDTTSDGVGNYLTSYSVEGGGRKEGVDGLESPVESV